MRISLLPIVFVVGFGTTATAQQEDPVALARDAGVCDPVGVADAEFLPDGRIAVECNTGGAEVGTDEAEVAGEETGASAGSGADTGFMPLIAPAAAIAGVAGVAAAIAGGSSSSDTQ